MENNVRKWVKANYPTEFQINRISNISFDTLMKEFLANPSNFEDIASVNGKGFDSEVREEIFNGLAEYYNVEYDCFYYLYFYKHITLELFNRLKERKII